MTIEQELCDLARKAIDDSATLRRRYRERVEVGKLAAEVWDRVEFAYGIEYGILIAVYEILEAHGLLETDEARRVFAAKVKR